MFGFAVEAVSGKARAGVLHIAHGKVETPFLMPVATKGSVKLLSNEEVASAGTQCLISNAFVLSMKPGLEVIEKACGLHKFMNWGKGLFTDSGGFQVLSKEFCLGLGNDGVIFRNPFIGRKQLFTPEESIKIQLRLGSDVAMCLDDVPHAGESHARIQEAVDRTILWASRCKEAHAESGNAKKQLLFGIAQGGTDKKLREKCSKSIAKIGFDGYALGGLCIGETKGKMLSAISSSVGLLPEDKPRYLMGVGSSEELVRAIAMGVDCFDSRFPTRTARHGSAMTSSGNLNLDSSKYRFDLKQVDKECSCFVCQSYSRAYIHHLFRTKEENAGKYLSYHNLFFVHGLIAKAREEIMAGKFRPEKFWPIEM